MDPQTLIDALPEPVKLTEVRRMSLKPDDVLVLRCKKQLNTEQIRHMTETMKLAFPEHRVAVLDCYMDLEIVEGKPRA